ncbi:hypothetical protein AK37_16270 [Rhodococcus pyridinivorans AK37]|uniref:Uncharacterized protein n=1 Tax=Rhodococcus pyridinivorans AK37 TaxID=1114960 RepID=H0JU82_9NOCA|nr:hypothetical protein AK37_16270 [Rhodococcus pyridinivorans AK37]
MTGVFHEKGACFAGEMVEMYRRRGARPGASTASTIAPTVVRAARASAALAAAVHERGLGELLT